MSHATLPQPHRPVAGFAGLTPAQLAAVSFLARYTGATHNLYRFHLGQFFAWCDAQDLDPLADVERVHVELYIRHRLVECGNAASSVNTCMTPVRGFYRFASIDGLITRNPAEYARLPKIHEDPAKKIGLSRLDLSRFLLVAETISPTHHALAHLIGILGLRISEACNVDVEHYQETMRGYRVLHTVRKGGKRHTVPLTVPVLRALDSCAGGRQTGALLLRRDGLRLDRHTGYEMTHTICRRAGFPKALSPHRLRASAITNALDAGVPLRDVQELAAHADPRTTMRYDFGRANFDRHAVHTLTAFVAGS